MRAGEKKNTPQKSMKKVSFTVILRVILQNILHYFILPPLSIIPHSALNVAGCHRSGKREKEGEKRFTFSDIQLEY